MVLVNNQRKVYLDILRIIAIFFVIFNHLDGYYLFLYSNGVRQWVYMIITMITRINVPLFFMISGSLLLGKEESFIDTLRNRIVRFVIILIVVDMGFLVISYFLGVFETVANIHFDNLGFPEFQKNKIYDVICEMLAGNYNYGGAYWYLFAYIGYLFMLPFLRSIADKMEEGGFLLLLLLKVFFSAVLPFVNIILSAKGIQNIEITKDFSVPLAVVDSMFYPLVGYYLDHKIDIHKINKNKWLILIAMCVLGLVFSSMATYIEGIFSGEFTQDHVDMFSYITAIVVFTGIKYIFEIKMDMPKKTGRVISYIGSLTFGIYLLDPYLKAFIYMKYNRYIGVSLPYILASFLWCIISMIVCGCITGLIKKIPVVKKYI